VVSPGPTHSRRFPRGRGAHVMDIAVAHEPRDLVPTLTDNTEVARHRAQFLAEAGTGLSSSLDYQATVQGGILICPDVRHEARWSVRHFGLACRQRQLPVVPPRAQAAARRGGLALAGLSELSDRLRALRFRLFVGLLSNPRQRHDRDGAALDGGAGRHGEHPGLGTWLLARSGAGLAACALDLETRRTSCCHRSPAWG
jgi:hypothetical protein